MTNVDRAEIALRVLFEIIDDNEFDDLLKELADVLGDDR